VISNQFAMNARKIENHQAFPTTIDPFGMRYPLYLSSSVTQCGTAKGATGCHLRERRYEDLLVHLLRMTHLVNSLTMAEMYGNDASSLKVGNCPGVTTRSSSS